MNMNFLKIVNISNISGVIKGANKTLSFVKQAIPIYNNSKPLIKSIRNNFGKNNISTLKTTSYKSKRSVKSASDRNYDINSITFFQ